MENDINQVTTTKLDSKIDDFSVSKKVPDAAADQKENYWDYPDSAKYLGYYKTIPELKKAIDSFATWVMGKGFTADSGATVILEKITGWGEDSIESIFWNMLVMKKALGDSFAEIIRNEEGTLVNLKPLYTGDMRVVVDNKGRIKRYEQRSGNQIKKFQPHEILHLVNDRVSNEIHGVSVAEACQWVIDARNEAMADWRRISHRSTIRVMYVDEEDTTTLNTLKSEYAVAIRDGEVMILPGKKGDMELVEYTLPPIDSFLRWIQYLENFFYQAVGIPKVILGGSEEFTEASSKIGYLTFEQIYMKEIVDLEHDIWNQLGLRIKFTKPASIKNELLQSEQKNTGQVGFQPNETQASLTRSE